MKYRDKLQLFSYCVQQSHCSNRLTQQGNLFRGRPIAANIGARKVTSCGSRSEKGSYPAALHPLAIRRRPQLVLLRGPRSL